MISLLVVVGADPGFLLGAGEGRCVAGVGLEVGCFDGSREGSSVGARESIGIGLGVLGCLVGERVSTGIWTGFSVMGLILVGMDGFGVGLLVFVNLGNNGGQSGDRSPKMRTESVAIFSLVGSSELKFVGK